MTVTLRRTLAKSSLLIACMYTAAILTGVSASAAGFSVENGRLYDARGNEFIMRGVSHPHVWYQNRTAQAIPDIAAKGANCVRVVLGSGKRWGPNSAQDVADVIQLCKDNNLIAILEVHDTTGFGEEPAAATIDEAVTYWISIKAVLMGQEDYVIINLGNEPFGNGVSASDYTTAHTNGIIRMRNEGFTHTLMVDGANWGQDNLGTMRTNAPTIFASDVLSNTIFSVHMYQVYANPATVNNYLTAFINTGLPFIVGEFAMNHGNSGDVAEAEIMLRCEEYGIGYIGWSWSGNGGSPGIEMLDMVINFDAASLSAWGQILFNGPNGISTTSEIATVFGADAPPVVSAASSTVTAGTPASLSVTSTEDPGATYQWQEFNGDWQDIAGATSSTLTIPITQRFHATQYRVIASTNRVPATSSAIPLTVQAAAPSNSRYTSLATRGVSQAGDNVLIPGFVIQGTGTKSMLIRAAGASLGNPPFSISGVLPDPRITLSRLDTVQGVFVPIDFNDNWGDNANVADIIQKTAELFAFELTAAEDSALLVDLAPGQYTVTTDDVAGASGIAIVELWEADSGTPTANLTSIATRGLSGPGNDVMIPGFVISSEGPKTVLIRVVGPKLVDFSVSDAMADPNLKVFQHNPVTGVGTLIYEQDDWGDNPDSAHTVQVSQQVFAFHLNPGSADASVVMTLPPGVYSVHGGSADGISTGVVLVEVYVVE